MSWNPRAFLLSGRLLLCTPRRRLPWAQPLDLLVATNTSAVRRFFTRRRRLGQLRVESAARRLEASSWGPETNSRRRLRHRPRLPLFVRGAPSLGVFATPEMVAGLAFDSLATFTARTMSRASSRRFSPRVDLGTLPLASEPWGLAATHWEPHFAPRLTGPSAANSPTGLVTALSPSLAAPSLTSNCCGNLYSRTSARTR